MIAAAVARGVAFPLVYFQPTIASERTQVCSTGFPQSWKVRESHGKIRGHGKVMENKNIKSHGK